MKATRGHGKLEIFLARQRIKMARRLIGRCTKYRERLLDVGCGTSPLFLSSTHFAEKWGLDRVVDSGVFVNGRGQKMTLMCYDAARDGLPFDDGFFDAVTMLAVFEHIEIGQLKNLLGEVHRVLRCGGQYVLTTPASWTPRLLDLMTKMSLVSREEIDEHEDAYSHAQICALLEEAGFDRKNIEYGFFEMGANIWVRVTK